MIDDHGTEITADFRRYYGLDILDVFRGSLSPRRCLALIAELPLDSAFHNRQLSDEKERGWDRTAFMLADVIDAIHGLHTTVAKSNSKSPRGVKQPPPYPTPRRKTKETTSNPFAEALRAEPPAGQSNNSSFPIPQDVLSRSGMGGDGTPFKLT
ncbi:hypothetical protein [Streptomyces cacaoi]|uniref:Uncharacterized protein n=1 Tax=Streptomyces cacaoi TaxID=1898 RepID=A0A4Y3R185_STRCI|nr:hypothetical protein [Streptomyces cacaoi]GEB50448.1 hypothetical protein SCA03_29990 [Streptomyces cacaoi]